MSGSHVPVKSTTSVHVYGINALAIGMLEPLKIIIIAVIKQQKKKRLNIYLHTLFLATVNQVNCSFIVYSVKYIFIV